MKPTLQGLTQKHWKQWNDIKIIANKEQKMKMWIELTKELNGDTKQALDRFNAECKITKVE